MTTVCYIPQQPSRPVRSAKTNRLINIIYTRSIEYHIIYYNRYNIDRCIYKYFIYILLGTCVYIVKIYPHNIFIMPTVISKYLDGRIIRRDHVSKGVLAAAVLLYGCKLGYPIVLKACGGGNDGVASNKLADNERRPSGESNDNNNTKGVGLQPATVATKKSSGKKSRAPGPGIDREFLIQLKKLLRLMVPGFWTPEVGLLSMHTLALVCRTFMSIFVATMEGKMVKYIVRRDVPNFGLMLFKWLLCALPATFLNSMIRYLECKLALAFR